MGQLFVRFAAMRYLSEEWIDAADAAVRELAASAPAQRLVIDQHVDDRVSYRIVIAQDNSSIRPVAAIPADASPADATFRQTFETASAIAQGTTDAHQAFLLGHIGFEGDITVLIERRPAFDWLAKALAPVLAATTF